MQIVVECICGEVYRANSEHLGYSIRCRCGRIIVIGESGSNPTSSSAKTLFENASVESQRPFFFSILLPAIGIVALTIGIILTVSSLRSENNVRAKNESTSPLPSNQPAYQNANLAQSVTNAVNKTSTNSAVSNSIQSNVANSSNSEAANADDFKETPIAQQEIATPTPEIVRYDTGKNLIAPSATGGRGTLNIFNGTNSDAIAKLVDASTGRTVRLTYIQSNSSFTLSGIRVGTYYLKFSLGESYVPEQGKFLLNQSYSQFDDAFTYGEYRSGNRIEWDTYRVTLNKVLNGNAQTSSISESEFEDK